MSITDQFRKPFAQLRSVDFWLFGASFMVSLFTLQSLGSVSRQTAALVLILAAGVAASIASKRWRNWTRRDTGWKGIIPAVGTLLFVGYAIGSLSISFASRRELELTGSFVQQALMALSDPVTFAGYMPFVFLGVYSAAYFLGLTDLPDAERGESP